VFDERKPFHLEHRLRRHDGEYRWVIDTGVPRFNADGSFAGYIGSAIDMTDRKLAEQALSTVSQKLIEAQEEERSWIARELHDDINQRLALLVVTLDVLTKDLPASSNGLKEMIDRATKELTDVSTDVQALSHHLHSSRLEHLGLAKTAASFCREMSDRHQVQIDFRAENVPSDLSKEASLCLFRVLQEALQNAIKYSGSPRYQITLSGQSMVIDLTVQGWGKGFRMDEAMKAGGIGLISMNERLKLVNGEVSIDSQPGRGAIIRARVPRPASAKPSGADA
jgi:signal transduction histidine kinase